MSIIIGIGRSQHSNVRSLDFKINTGLSILANLPYADGFSIEVRDVEGNLSAVLGTPLTAEHFELGSEATSHT